MIYYDQIKNKLINNEITKKVKDYSKNKSELQTFYDVGKLLYEAGKHYGKSIINEYSKKLTNELGIKYTKSSLYNMINFYKLNIKFQTMYGKLSWSHYCELFSITDQSEILYYIKISEDQNLSVRQLRTKIKNNEYNRLPEKTKNEIKIRKEAKISDFIKNPIIIKNIYTHDEISERALKKLILEDIDNFLKELGVGFCYVENEYKIKIGNRYNYIDLLLFNFIYNCFVVVELKITELKKEYIGQIETYMNYIDKNIKKVNQDETIGVIIVNRGNEFIMEYVSNNKIFETEYILN